MRLRAQSLASATLTCAALFVVGVGARQILLRAVPTVSPGGVNARETVAGFEQWNGASPPGPPPPLESLGPLDLGSLPGNRTLTRDLFFTNGGDDELRIEAVVSNCCCVRATVPGGSRCIPPGACGLLKLLVDTRGLSGRSTHAVTVFTNRETRPLRIAIEFTIVHSIAVCPRHLVFRGTVVSKSTRGQLLLTSTLGHPPWKVVGVSGAIASANPRDYEFEVEPLDDALRRRRLLTITFPGVARPGLIMSEVEIRTTSPVRPIIRVAIQVRVSPAVACSSKAVDFGHVGGGSIAARRRIRFVPADAEEDFSIRHVDYAPTLREAKETPRIQTTFGTDHKGWWVDVVLVPVPGSHGVSGRLQVATNCASAPLIELPVLSSE